MPAKPVKPRKPRSSTPSPAGGRRREGASSAPPARRGARADASAPRREAEDAPERDLAPARTPRVPRETSKRTRHQEFAAKPERLHKLLAQSGYGSRREMEEMIEAGRVAVDGETATVGLLVSPGARVKINGKLVQLKFSNRLPRVILYHKPEGEIVSRDDPEKRPSVFNALPRLSGGRWVAVGRLDFNTSGLLLFTTSGELANRLMHPRYNLVREYAVRVLGEISDEARLRLREGVELEDGPAKFAAFEDAGGDGANRWYRVALYEGRNREVRRMFESVGVVVSRLMRVRYGPFILPPGLRRGQVREIEAPDVQKLLADFGLDVPAPGRPLHRPRER
ncbi:pseudouridine synthase [Rhodocyclus tenuis]|uniref:Pseudouridine synthase n=1 Tax=Rhodocyclus tenuis TaxID=1066 RepID=A0A6L5JUM7_RHOTE|nr:pseudouridine synthase [Rhodocyclus gracilis]MQY51083.1 pseudouridine synthase [Rhodocyclus gracilis]MRD72033.1 pseudouridine synthase [Rhodocyclus gracilis]